MNYKTTIALVLLLAAVGAYFYFVEFGKMSSYEAHQQQKEQEAEAIEGELLFPDVTADAIQSLTLKHSDQTMTAKRDGDGWLQTVPVRCPLNSYLLDSIAEQIAGLRYLEKIDPSAPDAPTAQQMGLEPPRATVSFVAGDQKRVFQLGKVTLGGHAYLQIDGDSDYVIGTQLYGKLLDDPTTTWRKTSLDVPDVAGLDRIHIQAGDASFMVRRIEKWWIDRQSPGTDEGTDNTGQRADEESVDRLVSGIARLRIDGFVEDNPPNISIYGLDKPYLTISLTEPSDIVSESLAPTHTLHIGGTTLEGDKRFAAWTNDDEAISVVFTIADASIEDIPKTRDALRDPSVIDADVLDVREVIVQQDGQITLNLIRDPAEGYRFAEPAPDYEPDYVACHEMLSRLCELGSDRVIDQLSTLGEPVANVTVTLAGGKSIFLKIHGQGEDVAIVNGDESVAYLVPSDTMHRLLGPTILLRERTLLELSPDMITRLTLRRDDNQTFTIEPISVEDKDKRWQLSGYEAYESDAVESLVEAFDPLRAERWLMDRVEPGLAWATVTIEPVGGAPITLKVDPATGHATLTGLDASFVLPEEMIARVTAEYRPRSVLGIDANHIAAVKLTSGITAVTLKRDGPTYTTDAGDIGQETIAGVFDALAGLRVDRYTAPLHLLPDAVDFTLDITTADGESITLTFIKAPEDSDSITVNLTGPHGEAYRGWFTLSRVAVDRLRLPLTLVEQPMK